MHETPLFDGASDGAVDGPPSASDPARALLGALETLVARFTQAAERDPEVARACRVIGRWLHEQGSRQENPPAPAESRGWTRLYTEHVLQADHGADLDFLVGAGGAKVPRESH